MLVEAHRKVASAAPGTGAAGMEVIGPLGDLSIQCTARLDVLEQTDTGGPAGRTIRGFGRMPQS